MIFGSKHQETVKLGLKRMTVKRTDLSCPPLSAEWLIAGKDFTSAVEYKHTDISIH